MSVDRATRAGGKRVSSKYDCLVDSGDTPTVGSLLRIEDIKKREQYLATDVLPTGSMRGHLPEVVPMTSSTTSTRNGGLLETTFSTGATAIAAVSALLSVFIGWLGFTGGVFPGIGYQLDILTGA